MQLHSWFKDQKISPEILAEFEVSGDSHITFPVKDIDGTFIFNKYRRSPFSEDGMKYWYDKGGKVTLYGAFKAKESKSVLITEGEKDCLVAWSHNIPAVTSTGGAMSFQEEWEDFFADKNVIICFDNDKAGGEGMMRALKIVPHAKIMFIPDRANIKDVSDYVTSGGDLHALLKTAKNFTSMEDVIEDRANRISVWQSTFFHDSMIAEYKKAIENKDRAVRKIESNDKLERARAYPVENIIDFKEQGKAICPFHAENTPSLFHNQDTNTAYCFGGCGKLYDSIAIYMKVHNCDFKTAINQMQS